MGGDSTWKEQGHGVTVGVVSRDCHVNGYQFHDGIGRCELVSEMAGATDLRVRKQYRAVQSTREARKRGGEETKRRLFSYFSID